MENKSRQEILKRMFEEIDKLDYESLSAEDKHKVWISVLNVLPEDKLLELKEIVLKMIAEQEKNK